MRGRCLFRAKGGRSGQARARIPVLKSHVKGSAMSIEFDESRSCWTATDGFRTYLINPGTSGFVVRDPATDEQIAAIADLSEVEDL